ncbi:Aste57867_21948 [Aphanomyces stellatus]|uniref:Aste57867_21948 protein n=1 Tax=Aphanomyces stellatus TaxID=120398 RepID=A0A485LK80_9STRA|nr:hypothetical protein As57867_021879 [Aphanomyces stellatus]VFT98616.1 Aste57867_21948 [Aphanomyces stellatus]
MVTSSSPLRLQKCSLCRRDTHGHVAVWDKTSTHVFCATCCTVAPLDQNPSQDGDSVAARAGTATCEWCMRQHVDVEYAHCTRCRTMAPFRSIQPTTPPSTPMKRRTQSAAASFA